MNPELPSVLLMAPTGVAAININGTTVNTALAIPRECGNNVPAMSDQRRTQMRLSLAELKLIIIDEISMVSNMGLLHIHQRLKEIFVTPNSELFAGISVLVFGDFFQLPPIRSTTTFSNYKNDTTLVHGPHGGLRDRSFFIRRGGLVVFARGATRKNSDVKGGSPQEN
jgi:hypothetical protein